jgi:hypothetical protein
MELDTDTLISRLVSARERREQAAVRADRDEGLASVRRGYYRAADLDLRVADEHILRVAATARARQPGLVISHNSAAVLWNAPVMNAELGEIHALQPGRPRRTTAGVRVHRSAVPDDQVVELSSGLLVTSREWTAIQIAAVGTLPNVLVPLDDLIRQICTGANCDRRAVVDALIGLVPPRTKGCARAVRNLELADARSGSAGESLSRGQMLLLGLPRPDLQVGFPRGDLPGHDVVDFDWPELDSFGEFDGKGKYARAELRNGRSAEEVLWDEKVREDRVRRHHRRAARWGWDVAMSRPHLERVLALAGVRSSAALRLQP